MISNSLFPKAKIPNVDLPTFMFEYAKEHTVYGRDPKLVAIVGATESLSFADLESRTVLFASGLYNQLGFRRDDILATVLPNSSSYPVAVMGTQMVGGVVTTANPDYTARELAHQFHETQPKVVVTLHKSVAVIKEALGIAGLTIPDKNILTADESSNSMRNIFSQNQFPRVYLQSAHEASTTPAFIVFSSGTSGKPKGVVLSHKNMVANAVQFLQIDRSDTALMSAVRHKFQRRWLQVLPMFHIYGILISNVCILSGAVMVVMEKFDFGDFCSLIQDHRIDTVYVAPPIILALAKSPAVSNYDISSLVFINSGAAPLSKELQLEAEQKLKTYVTQGYGMSETSPFVTRSMSGANVPGSAGQLCPNTEAIFLDEDDKPVGVGQTGELCVRGPQVMIGYYKNEQATKDTLGDDGFLHTGDIGHIDETGHIYITDRKKELIKYKGFQIPPAELEGLLTDHPAVVDAAVIPIYDESRATELPKAFVVIRPGAKTPGIETEISQWIDKRVVNYKRLRGGIEIIDAIPKSATGKILRRVLKDLEASRLKQKAKL
ncbi:hypothetical protein IWW56_004109 [Coemansia sp. RSA 2131]|nr:hypothetical protein IWW56_004109 [Coemansia sp. RSA 2131]